MEMNTKIIRKVCVACTNANGEPDILFFKIEATEDIFEETGLSEYIPLISTEEYDYEGPFVYWEETDCLFKYMDCEEKFEWDTANIHEVL